MLRAFWRSCAFPRLACEKITELTDLRYGLAIAAWHSKISHLIGLLDVFPCDQIAVERIDVGVTSSSSKRQN